MAEEILFGLAQEIIKNLGSQILQEIALSWGAKDELKKLENTVSSIQAVLLDAEDQSAVNHQVKDWLGKLKEAMYDADDLSDDFSTEALRRRVMSGGRITKEVRLFFSRSNQFVYALKMGREVRGIREKIDEISADRRDFHLVERPISSDGSSNTFMTMRKGLDEESFVDEKDVIGRDEDKDAILKRLMDDGDENENVCVIPIVGIGGLGKTTLARLVYNSSQVQDQFAVKMWVCVSEPFEEAAILQEAIKSTTGTGPEGSELRRKFRDITQGKKYLLVLDDVWNEVPLKWDRLEVTLCCGERGSRVIVTTRSMEVAKICSKLEPHKLKGLSSDKAWDLFEQTVRRRQELKTVEEANEIGKKICDKCKGVPLAIKTIACLLWGKDPKTKWRPFLDNELSKIEQNEGDILPTLKLSYDHLSSHLKQCFAYCGLFPKDFEIDVQKLIHHWIAHGFVEQSESKTLEEVGKEYFEELWQRSFFQEVRDDREECKMHDLMQDLAVSVAGSEIAIIDMQEEANTSNTSTQKNDDKIRHVLFKFNKSMRFPDSLNVSKGLRTILVLPTFWLGEAKVDNTEAILSKYRHLRVFGLCGCDDESLDYNIIGKLKHLRYLDLSWRSKIEVLPNSIIKLVNLQVLDLRGCSLLRQLPRDIKKLINLRHLYNNHCDKLSHMPSGIGQLTSLKTLSMFVLSEEEENRWIGGLDELKGLNKLRGTLGISNLKYLRRDAAAGLREAKAANLKAKQHLQELRLDWFESSEEGDEDDDERCLEMLQPHHNLKALVIDGYSGVIFPSWISSLSNLVALTLRGCERIRHLPTSRQLPALEELTTVGAHDLEYIEEEEEEEEEEDEEVSNGKRGHISSLKTITILRCPKLEGWWKKKKKSDIATDEGEDQQQQQIPQFSRLSHLNIWDCKKLTWMPLFPTIEAELLLEKTSIEPLKQTMKMMTDRNLPSSSSSSLLALHPPLSKLKVLRLTSIDDLDEFPEEWLHKLTSLRVLEIYYCPNLLSVPRRIRHHTSWQSLCITGCPKLRDADGNTIDIQIGW